MQERFGSWQVGGDSTKGRIEFKIFFPDHTTAPGQYDLTQPNASGVANYGDPQISSIRVIGDFQPLLGQGAWDTSSAPLLVKAPHPNGVVWSFTTPVELPANFYEYQYFVTYNDGTTRTVSDPCARYGGSRYLDKDDPNPRDNLNAGIVVGGSVVTVKPIANGRKHLRDLVIYELNLDDFTDEYRGGRAPLDAVVDKLKHIKDLGFNAILVMPWTEWPGKGFNWGYEPFLYFSVAFRYANGLNIPTEKLSYLKNFINECHAQDIHVIMDGVFNHVSGNKKFPYYLFYKDERTSPYTGKFGGTFSSLEDLDFHNGCLEEFVRDVCLYWIDSFGIDGIRFDNTTNFFIWDNYDNRKPNPLGLPNLIAAINSHVGDPNFSTTLEHLRDDASLVVNAVQATSYWNNALYGVAGDSLLNYSVPPRVIGALNSKNGLTGNSVATTYLTNHDHSNLAWLAGAKDNQGSLLWFRTQPLAILLLTASGCPMIHNGQEFAEDYWLVEDDRGGGRRVQPRPLHWSYASDNFGKPLGELYRKLIKIRNNYSGLRSDNIYPVNWQDSQNRRDSDGFGIDQESGIVIYHRYGNSTAGALQRFIIVLNFSMDKRTVTAPFSVDGTWEDLLSSWKPSIQGNRLTFEVGSNWGHVFFKEN